MSYYHGRDPEEFKNVVALTVTLILFMLLYAVVMSHFALEPHLR